MISGSCHCGAARFTVDDTPQQATACNCTICRRYGVLWAYGWQDADVHIEGDTHFYSHGDRDIEFHFCPTCGVTTWWRGAQPGEDGSTRIAVNLRLCDPDPIADIPLRHFDGFDSWNALPDDGRCVKDMWF